MENRMTRQALIYRIFNFYYFIAYFFKNFKKLLKNGLSNTVSYLLGLTCAS